MAFYWSSSMALQHCKFLGAVAMSTVMLVPCASILVPTAATGPSPQCRMGFSSYDPNWSLRSAVESMHRSTTHPSTKLPVTPTKPPLRSHSHFVGIHRGPQSVPQSGVRVPHHTMCEADSLHRRIITPLENQLTHGRYSSACGSMGSDLILQNYWKPLST